MKYDIIIIGGGLSGLTAGIALSKRGKRVCIVSAGQNSLHFGSGSFDLLGYDTSGEAVANPLAAIAALPQSHPYHVVGDDRIEGLAANAKQLLADAGIATVGDATENHYRITPIGAIKPTWLTIEGMATARSLTETKWEKADLVNITGFLDFPLQFLTENLRNAGTHCTVRNISTKAMEQARKSPTEMRAVNVAKYLDDDDDLEAFAQAINAYQSDAEIVLVPAVLGFNNATRADMLKSLVRKPVAFVATMPPSVTGMRASNLLKQCFQQLGGTILVSDTVVAGHLEDHRVKYVVTNQLPDETLSADHFILASGSFLSHGLKSDYEKVYEPVFGVDVEAAADRSAWTRENVFDVQPYMSYGVKTDNELHALKNGEKFDNLYAIGSILCGNNDIKLASNAGVAMLTALRVAEIIK